MEAFKIHGEVTNNSNDSDTSPTCISTVGQTNFLQSLKNFGLRFMSCSVTYPLAIPYPQMEGDIGIYKPQIKQP